MLTREGLRELRGVLAGRHVLTVYLDGHVSDPAGRRAWRSWLASALTAARQVAERGSAGEAAAFDACRKHLEARLEAIKGALGSEGFVAFVTEESVALAEGLPVRMPNLVRWTVDPWLSPYIRAQKELRPVIVVTVGANAARIDRYAQGDLLPLERLHAHTNGSEPAHMGSTPRPAFHPGTRGATAKDAAQRARLAGTQRMLRELMDRLGRLASGDEWILIGGTRADVAMSQLPERLRQRAAIVPGLNLSTAVSVLRRAAASGGRKLRREADDRIVQRASEEAARQALGVTGEHTTRKALARDAVQQLLFTETFMAQRSDQCEQLIRAALSGGATMEHVAGAAADHLDQVGGIGAILRYALSAAKQKARPMNKVGTGSRATGAARTTAAVNP